MARILIIDDNRDNLDLMLYLVTAFGHDAVTAETGADGIAIALRETPDLVLCDVHMPDIDGYAVVHAIKRDPAARHIPVLAVTAMAMIGDRERGLSAGFDGYISKPIDPETFVGQLHGFLHADQHGTDPVPAHSLAATGANAPATPSPCVARVLVVDDAAANCELVCQILRPLGYEVRAASHVREGLHLAREATPDLVITDLHMPGDDGFELVRSMKADARLATVPIIVFTSSAWGERQRVQALQLGANRFLLRPIEPQKLLEEIATCLADNGGNGQDPRR